MDRFSRRVKKLVFLFFILCLCTPGFEYSSFKILVCNVYFPFIALTTVEGILQNVIDGLEQQQEIRKVTQLT